jgi:hypothetical protein
MTRLVLTAAAVATLTVAAAVAVSAQRGPAPAPTHIPPDVLALACAPKAVYEMPPRPLRITGGQDDVERRIYSPGDLITINAGTNNGIEVGQEYFVRRVLTEGDRRVSYASPGNIRTTGWIRIYAVDKEMSLATISYSCETIDVGDYLEPLALPAVPVPQADAPRPQRSNYARIMFGTDRRRSFAVGDFFVIDHGTDHGVAPGARFVVYHDKLIPGNFLYEAGEAVAVDVQPETSTLKVTLSRTALMSGDYVAIRK